MQQLIDFTFDDGGLEMFAPLPSVMLKCDGDHDDVLQFLQQGAADQGPTSSSSDVGSGSSGRDSATPGIGSGTSGAVSQSATGASWLQMAPQMGAQMGAMQPAAPASAPVLHSMGTQPQQLQYQQWQPAVWHSAFSAETTTQHTCKESKITVSHSTIEKQRRDRINSLIDELRELVPPSASVKGPDGGDIKRPKHVVLSDTIALLRHLKEKVQHDEMEKQRMHMIHQQMAAGSMVSTEPTASAAMTYQPPVVGIMAGAGVTPMALSMPSTLQQSTTLAGALGQSAQSLLQHSLSGSLSSHAAATASTAVFGPSSCPELPQAPPNLPSAVGVLVEEGPGCSFLVKVNCRDRHGLLSDITQALGCLPLQITRAAITTGNGGAVYDVFEIMAEPSAGHEAVTALDVQFHVHQALYKWKTANPAAAAAADQAAGIAIGKRQRL